MYNFTNKEFTQYVDAIIWQTSDKIKDYTFQKSGDFLIFLLLCMMIQGEIFDYPLFHHLSKESCNKFKNFINGSFSYKLRKEWLKQIIFEKLKDQQKLNELAQCLLSYDTNPSESVSRLEQCQTGDSQSDYYCAIISAAMINVVAGKTERQLVFNYLKKAVEIAQELNNPANLLLAEVFAKSLANEADGLELYCQIKSLESAKLNAENQSLRAENEAIRGELTEKYAVLLKIAEIADYDAHTPKRPQPLVTEIGEKGNALKSIVRIALKAVDVPTSNTTTVIIADKSSSAFFAQPSALRP